jgi:hypothetical protein
MIPHGPLRDESTPLPPPGALDTTTILTRRDSGGKVLGGTPWSARLASELVVLPRPLVKSSLECPLSAATTGAADENPSPKVSRGIGRPGAGRPTQPAACVA